MAMELLLTTFFLAGQISAPEAPAPASAAAAETIDVRYARAQLQLAQANLQRVEQINRRVARTVPASVVAECQRDLDVAQEQMRQAETRSAENEFAVWIRRAESIWKNADTLWKNGVAVNQRSPRTFEALDIERFRLRAEVTRLQLERGQSLIHAPRETQLAWQLDLVNHEVQRLREESRAAPFSHVWRVWWY